VCQFGGRRKVAGAPRSGQLLKGLVSPGSGRNRAHREQFLAAAHHGRRDSWRRKQLGYKPSRGPPRESRAGSKSTIALDWAPARTYAAPKNQLGAHSCVIGLAFSPAPASRVRRFVRPAVVQSAVSSPRAGFLFRSFAGGWCPAEVNSSIDLLAGRPADPCNGFRRAGAQTEARPRATLSTCLRPPSGPPPRD